MTLDEFLDWERRQELRYEFDGTRPVAMTGGTVEHSEIATSLVEALRRRSAGKPCRAFRGDLKVLLEQARRAATVFSRVGGDWTGHVVTGNAVPAMPEVGGRPAARRGLRRDRVRHGRPVA